MQRKSVDQDFLIANLANITTEKVIQPQVEDVQVKEPESLKSFQIVDKTKTRRKSTMIISFLSFT